MFKPRSIPMGQLDSVHLEFGELEAMRLCDVEGLDQKAAGRRMGVSRGTVQRLLKQGRRRVISAILNSQALVIEPGESDEALYSD